MKQVNHAIIEIIKSLPSGNYKSQYCEKETRYYGSKFIGDFKLHTVVSYLLLRELYFLLCLIVCALQCLIGFSAMQRFHYFCVVKS